MCSCLRVRGICVYSVLGKFPGGGVFTLCSRSRWGLVNAGSILGTSCFHPFLCLSVCGLCSVVFAIVFAKRRGAEWRYEGVVAAVLRTLPHISRETIKPHIWSCVRADWHCVWLCLRLCLRKGLFTTVFNSIWLFVISLLCLQNACLINCVWKCVHVFSVRKRIFAIVFGCVWAFVFRLCVALILSWTRVRVFSSN